MPSVQIYANPMEQKDMEICHPHAIKLMKTFLMSMHYLTTTRALDVAAGNGRVTQSLLLSKY